VIWYLTLIANVIYAVARLALLVLVLRSLFPPNWLICVHIGGRDSSFFLKCLFVLSMLAYRIVSPFIGRDIARMGKGVSLGWGA
jgi:hypothetical protein